MAALFPAGVTKLTDANDAGTRNSHLCTLILTEGDSAKTLAMSGLSVVGHDHWGVFPLRCAALWCSIRLFTSSPFVDAQAAKAGCTCTCRVDWLLVLIRCRCIFAACLPYLQLPAHAVGILAYCRSAFT
jgi:hypothetical protein